MHAPWPRTISTNLRQHLFRGKVIIIYGPRQVGKTTLCQQLLAQTKVAHAYFNCEDPQVKSNLLDASASQIATYLGTDKKLIILDEAQAITNIGRTIKLVHDAYPQLQIIATGSSSFDLANQINEPLTGRKLEYLLYPLSMSELYPDARSFQENLSDRLIYGSYPEIVKTQDRLQRIQLLQNLASSYLYKDILSFENIKSPDVLDKILRALALQLGGEVSYNELATLVGVDKNTVARYIRLLEQSFIIFRLPPLVRNRRDEIRKLRKIYFYDLGLRNTLINAFNDLPLRADIGALWENFLICERLKKQHNCFWYTNNYYWRTHRNEEIDWVEEFDEKLYPYEFKWQKTTSKRHSFNQTYPQASTIRVINQKNFYSFLTQRLMPTGEL